ncbi:MAG: SEC-C domain-containing protein [Sandaracinaceae bacterium]|nr:SEC-C domain-containing protein [Sandaracinaceae bacterium]
MSYLSFTPGFAANLFADYLDGRDLSRSIPGTDAIDAEHFAVQMVGAAALMSLPVDEIGELEGEGGVRDDLVSLTMAARLSELARERPEEREALRDRVERLHLRVAESPVATTAISYQDLYSDLAWSLSARGEHERALDMARRAVAHSLAHDGGMNTGSHLRDLARHVFIARPDEGARLWARIIEHDPTDLWTYVQLGHLGSSVGLPDLARRARRRGVAAIHGRDDDDARSVREGLAREDREEIVARPCAISGAALAELYRALDQASAPGRRTSDLELAHELIPNLASVPVKRRATAADVPPREGVLGALLRANGTPASADPTGIDLPGLGRPSPVRAAAVPARTGPNVARNAPCPCGSGRKWKKCCGGRA